MRSIDTSHHTVTAVVVTHDGARWLPETLRAVRAQTRPVQRVVGVDTGSADASPHILAEHMAAEAIVTLPRDTGFGAAVRAGLDQPRAAADPAALADGTEWVWIVHDDCAPTPDALHHLLAAAARDRRAAILGPKLRDWFDRRLLIEVGVTIDGAGRRETGLEPREFDQGQHDGTRQVLAVSSAGMLVRRDVWDQLDGFDPVLPLFRDDIDLCWRAGMLGHRTLIVTDAVAHHAEAAARHRRGIEATRGHPQRIDRRNAVYVLLANLPYWAMVGALLRNSVASFLRVLLYLLAKRPGSAADEFVAVTAIYLMPLRLVRARFRRRRGRRRTYSAIRPFLAHGVAVRRLVELVSALASGGADTSGRHQARPLDQSDGDELILDSDEGLLRRLSRRSGLVLFLGLTTVTLVAERDLLRGGTLVGGALLPVWGGATDLWSLYLGEWHQVGAGSSVAAPPYVAVLALLSTLTFGNPQIAVTVVLLGCVPLAGLSAYLLARHVLEYRPARLWMAASYALLPVATGAVAQGRVGTALVHALLPVLGVLLARVLTLPRRPARRSAWALALLLAVATAFVPLVWPLAVLTVVLAAVVFQRQGQRGYGSLAIALLVPLLLLMPWTLRLFRYPSLWLLEAGLHRPELSDPALSPPALLLLSPGGPGMPPLWVTAGFLLAALCALLLRERRLLVATGWGVALVGILVAILVSRVVVTGPDGGQTAAAWPGVALAFAATAMLLSAATAAQAIGTLFRLGGLRRLGAVAITALALTTPVAAAGAWMWQGVDGPITARGPQTLPPLVTVGSEDGTQPRTLVLRVVDDGVLYSVLRGSEPRVGEAQLPPEPAVAAELDELVAQLAGGRGGDEAAVLAELGIQYVLLAGASDADGDTAAPDPHVVGHLDGTPGMRRLTLTTGHGLWRVAEDTGHLRVVDPRAGTDPVVLDSEAPEITVPPGTTTRMLVLAEPVDDRWSATLDGAELRPTQTGTGMQAFELPADGGILEVDRRAWPRQAWLAGQGVLLAVVIILALPAIGAPAAPPGPEPRPARAAGPRGNNPRAVGPRAQRVRSAR